MDKETLSNYGWIVICVLVMSVMIAFAGPFGQYISDAIKSTTQGLFDVNENALETIKDEKVFGVCWNKSISTALTRLTPENDPNELVTVEITSEPSPAQGTGTGSSPFDEFAPWSEMQEYNVINGRIAYSSGDAGFNRELYDTVVYIPEFYVKTVEENGMQYFYISDKPLTGFVKHPGSGNYVARYNTGAEYSTTSGQTPITNITRAEARTNSLQKGNGWGQYDYITWNAVQYLYLIEFADWDAQKVIGLGNVLNNDSSAILANGATDTMNYHTGYAGTNGYSAVQYRHIENPWGNVCEWVDGVNIYDGQIYISTDYKNYADDTSVGYTDSGLILPATGHITSMGFSSTCPYAFAPVSSRATTDYPSEYIPDKVCHGDGWRIAYTSNNAGGLNLAGIFRFSTSSASNRVHASYGCRLVFHSSGISW